MYGRQRFLVGSDYTVGESLNVPSDIGYGGAKFMGQVGNQIPPHLIGASQFLYHGVKGAAQITDFVSRIGFGSSGIITM